MDSGNTYNRDDRFKTFTDFVEGLPTGIIRTTLEGKIVYCNETFARLFGFESAKEATGYPIADLYKSKSQRGDLIKAIIKDGLVSNYPVRFIRKDNTAMRCLVTSKPVFDMEGTIAFLDSVISSVTDRPDTGLAEEMVHKPIRYSLCLDPKGVIMDADPPSCDLLGVKKDDLVGCSFKEFIMPKHHDLFDMFLANILHVNNEKGLLSVRDRTGGEHQVQFNADLIMEDGVPKLIQCTAIGNLYTKSEIMASMERFKGVLEMAGSVAPNMNQPLTVINNLVSEILTIIEPRGSVYKRILAVRDEMAKLNQITEKIGGIKQYKSMDYVAGVKIVDLDGASTHSTQDSQTDHQHHDP